jgi:dihydroflavonol-4-reductase
MQTLVTGANGHLGYNLVVALRDAGHRVRAGVRSLGDPAKTARLKALGGVELVEAELRRPDQLRAAMDGIDVAFHAAAVYDYVTPGRGQEILDASVRGAEAALRAAADARVRKVVLTSSVVTLPFTAPDDPPSDENDGTTDLRVPYVRAKTEGERVAWRVAGELGLNMVTVLPGAILGPGFARNTPSIDAIEAMSIGALRFGAPDMNFPLVDVRDVVAAHLLAAEKDCEGRFAAINDTQPTFRSMLETMHAIDPKIPLPMMQMPRFLARALPLFDRLNHAMLGTPKSLSSELAASLQGKIWNVSNRRAKERLGWRQSITMEQSLRDTLETIRANRSRHA